MAVSDLIADARVYTSDLTTQASNAMDDAIDSVRAIGYAIPGYTDPVLPTAPTLPIDLTAPTLAPVDLTLPTEPTDPLVFQDIPSIELGTLPTLTAVAPTITLPTQPNQVADFTEGAPVILTDFVFPEPPAELLQPLFTAPVIADRATPIAPTVALPSFEGVAPTGMPDAPTDYEERYRSAYAEAAPETIAMVDGYVDAMMAKYNPQYHTQMAAIETQLSRYIAGGTGLSANVEDAIYERARDKGRTETRRAIDAAYNEAADRGFSMPPGFLLAATQQARQAGADNLSRSATDIAVSQAELEQKNLQFAVTTSIGLRSTMLNAALSYMQSLVTINGQALEYAKGRLSAIIEVYNSAVKAWGAKLDAYKAETAVYETRLKASLATIDLYLAEIKALETLTTVDRARVDIYRARIESLTALSNVYRAQIEAVGQRAGLEKIKLDLFSTKVQAFNVRVQAKNSEWQGYAASINGQSALSRLYGDQVQAYVSQLKGYETSIGAQTEVVRAASLTNQARATQYKAVLDVYTAVVGARGEVARTKLEVGKQQLLAFTAQVQASTSNASIRNDYYKTVSQSALQSADLRFRAQIATIDSIRNFGTTLATLGTANAHIFSGIAGAALSGMNSLASASVVES
jgi:hypothetical protein